MVLEIYTKCSRANLMFGPYQSIITPTLQKAQLSHYSDYTNAGLFLGKTEIFSSPQYLHWLCSKVVINHHQHNYLLCFIRQVVLMVINNYLVIYITQWLCSTTPTLYPVGDLAQVIKCMEHESKSLTSTWCQA
jgi:hypothetical protein